MEGMSNRLADSTSPYLLQHKDNPVDWYPWGDEALDLARAVDRPILLSIGYAACHWCHVMERESFEDEKTAEFMNGNFVCVKVDREERPDIDAIYMEAVQSITGHGGWPLTVFLDPDGVPFHGGTYFPPDTSLGGPSFMMVMEAVLKAFDEKRENIRAQSADVRNRLGAVAQIAAPKGAVDPGLPADRVSTLLENIDPDNGGFGAAPKFPPASTIDFLNSMGELGPVELTLDRMAAGGIYDQLGGGFSRYSVDASWQVPHFEKMLYDNALLARSYLRGYQSLGHRRYRRICEETLDWALREMRDPAGGFHASLDADSEGEEGLFYTWTRDEIEEALGDEAALAVETWGVVPGGNFEGRSVLRLPAAVPPEDPGEDVAAIRARLMEVRAGRIRPARPLPIQHRHAPARSFASQRASTAFTRSDCSCAAQCPASTVSSVSRTPTSGYANSLAGIYIKETGLQGECVEIEVPLTDRADMGVPMLLGRASIGGRFLVHPARIDVLSARKRKTS